MSQTVNAFNDDLAVIQKLDDEPNDVGGLTAEQLKAKFDQAALALQKYINEVLVEAHNALGLDLDTLAERLANHVDVDPSALKAENVAIAAALVEKFGLGDKLAPTVHDALEKTVSSAGDTMTGILTVETASYPRIQLSATDVNALGSVEQNNRRIYVISKDLATKNKRALSVRNQSEGNLTDALELFEWENDVFKCAYQLLHTGNLEALGISRIVSGTVTGASKAGEDSPNSITFPFKPKLVYVTKPTRTPYNSYSSMKFDNFLWVEGVTSDTIANTNYGGIYRYYELDGNTLSWWVSDTQYAAAVCGSYVAIG